MVVAVGPEGGWDEPEEIERFTDRHCFQKVTLGQRTLRSDCAVVSLLALAHDACDDPFLLSSHPI
jgi:RsmE family RNA methyltransferase